LGHDGKVYQPVFIDYTAQANAADILVRPKNQSLKQFAQLFVEFA
jgi:hypothetical protein